MADQKLTEKGSLVDLADGDLIHVVDVSDVTSGADGTSKKSLWSLFKSTLKTYFDAIYEPLKGADDNYVTDAEKVVIETQAELTQAIKIFLEYQQTPARLLH
jgi:hypothetical protein